MLKTDSLYQIRNCETGKYSNGGMSPGWGPRGKVWSSLANLKNHLAMFVNTEGGYMGKPYEVELDKSYPYHNCEIIEYEVINRVTGETLTVDGLSAYMMERRKRGK